MAKVNNKKSTNGNSKKATKKAEPKADRQHLADVERPTSVRMKGDTPFLVVSLPTWMRGDETYMIVPDEATGEIRIKRASTRLRKQDIDVRERVGDYLTKTA